jgi:putative transposase
MKLVKKILIKPSKSQKETIDFWLRRCCLLYNIALEEKIIYYKSTGKSLSMYEQKKELVDIKEYDKTWKEVPNKSLQDVIIRLDKSFKGFFSRGFKGFPKFKHEYNSLYFVSSDVKNKSGELYLPKIKEKIKYTGDLPEKYSSCLLKKENYKYFMCFIVDVEPKKLNNNSKILGVDLGLMELYTDSNGHKQKRFSKKLIKKYYKRINDLNKSLITKKKSSIRRKKVKQQLNKTYKRLEKTKIDFLHKVSLKLIKSSEDNIIVGDIKIGKIISKSNKGLRKSFYLTSLGIFKNFIEYKSKLNGKNLIFVNEAYTSKTCSCCGHIKVMKLSDRVYSCEICKNSIDRDHNSAINMKLLGSSIMGNKPMVVR